MTKEKRIIFSLNDIKAIRHQCPECNGEVVHQISPRNERFDLLFVKHFIQFI